ncbi:MAG: hypothetical protein ACREYF_11225, partial [Gammaproteobacteria bacterium]
IGRDGSVGAPFRWDEEKRRHVRARLDALYFLLYGVQSRESISAILDSFPIVQESDLSAFGKTRTKELILGYVDALKAGDTETTVEV